jgi:hypothetical protein
MNVSQVSCCALVLCSNQRHHSRFTPNKTPTSAATAITATTAIMPKDDRTTADDAATTAADMYAYAKEYFKCANYHSNKHDGNSCGLNY